MTTTPAIPPTEVIRRWSRVAEDTGTLDQTLQKFAALLVLADAAIAQRWASRG